MCCYIPEAYRGNLEVVFLGRKNVLKEIENSVSDSKIIDAVFLSEIDEMEDAITDSTECIVVTDELVSHLEKINEMYPDKVVLLVITDSKGSGNWKEVSDKFSDHIRFEDIIENASLLEKRLSNLVKSSEYNSVSEKVLDRITDSFLAIDNESRITYANEEAARMFKKSREELIGSQVWDAFPEALGTDFESKYHEAMRTQEPVYFEEYYPPLDSWFAVKGYPTDSGITAYLEDITDRKEKQEELEKRLKQQQITTDLLRMALEQQDIVDIQMAAVEKVAEVLENDYVRILKFDEEKDGMVVGAQFGMQISDIGEKVLDIEEDMQEAFTFSQKETIKVTDYNTETDFRRSRLMEFLNVRSGVSVMIGEYSDPWGVLSTFSRRSKNYSEGEIRFLEGVANVLATTVDHQEKHVELEKYQRAVDSVNYGIYMVDSNGEIIMANKAFQDLSGYKIRELIGQESSFLEVEGECAVIQRSDGRELDVSIKSVPITLPNGTRGQVSIVRKKGRE